MIRTAIHLADILLWLIMACSTAYVLLFALVALIPRRRRCSCRTADGGKEDGGEDGKNHSFLILFPAYHEDNVILQSVKTFLRQDYPADKYHVTVVSDHMSPETDKALAGLPLTLLTPVFDRSSKARAMQYAMENTGKDYDYVVILDADNIVEPDFLRRLNRSCQQGHRAIQCHRCAKNSDSDVAMLDGVSEEINNTLFRKAHNRIGLSSALIGSGMCFSHEWFRANVPLLSTAGEDRELESLLMLRRVYIKYEEDIHVRDEKVSSGDNFQRQRLRWMSAQVNSLLSMLPHIPQAIASANIDFIDKTVQQMLVPRSILLVVTLFMAAVTVVAAPAWSVKWWVLFVLLCLALLTAVPPQMRTRTLFGHLPALPGLAMKMLCNIIKIDKSNKEFIHTSHDK